MTISYLIQPQSSGEVRLRYQDEDTLEIVNRRVIVPGSFIDGTWVPTDISEEEPDVQAACTELWLPEVIADWQATHPPAVPMISPGPAILDPVEKLRAFLAANVDVRALLGM